MTRLVNDEELVIQARNALNSQAVLDATLFDARAIPGVRAARENSRRSDWSRPSSIAILAFDVAEAFYAVLSAERLRAAAARRGGGRRGHRRGRLDPPRRRPGGARTT